MAAGPWIDEMTARRARQNALDAARLADPSQAPVMVLGERLGRECPGCGHMFRSRAHDVCELCHINRERVSAPDGLFGGTA
jgi:hypothetical protein